MQTVKTIIIALMITMAANAAANFKEVDYRNAKNQHIEGTK